MRKQNQIPFPPTLKGVNLIFKESFDSTRNQELTSEIFALRKIKISSIQIFQQAIPKNLHCLSGGNNFESMHTLYFRPSFGDFLRRNFNFLAKRSSLELFVTFCFKTKSKAKKKLKFLCSQNEENLVFQRAHDVIVMQWRSIFGFETQFDEKTKSNSFSQP